MKLLELSDKIKNRKSYNTPCGTIERIFEIYERHGKQMDGQPYEFIKPELKWRHNEHQYPIRVKQI